MKKNRVLAIALGPLLAILPGQAFSQAQVATAPFDVSGAEAEMPPFCFECQTVWFGYPDNCWAPICTAVGEGNYRCISFFDDCQDNGCSSWDSGCIFDPRAIAPDGSVRAPDLFGLSNEAIAALLGSDSADGPVHRRRCDGAVVVRRVDATVASEQRRITSRIGI